MVNELDYVELGLNCADICGALDRGMNGKRLDDLSQSVYEAINQLTTWVQQEMHSLDSSMTMFPIAELWGRSRRRSSNRAGGTRSLDFSVRRTTGKQSPVGSQSSTGSCVSSTCVQSSLLDPSPTVPFQTELAMNTHTIVSDIHRKVLGSQEGTDEKHLSVSDTCALSIVE